MNIFTHGSVTFTHPYNSTDALNYFALSGNALPPELLIDSWHPIGANGICIRKLGTGGRSGTVTGMLDASSEANLRTGILNLEAKCQSGTPEDAVLAGYGTINTCLLTSVVWSPTKYLNARYVIGFVLAFIAPD